MSIIFSFKIQKSLRQSVFFVNLKVEMYCKSQSVFSVLRSLNLFQLSVGYVYVFQQLDVTLHSLTLQLSFPVFCLSFFSFLRN